MNLENTNRFEFGKNWAEFVQKHFSQERVDISRAHMLEFLEKDSLEGMSFLDIGCGSGLHSFAAWQSGAKSIYSFDFDPKSVAATNALHELANYPKSWEIAQGSVLDEKYMEGIKRVDIVYSWGVLHHTGDVWKAIRLACSKVKPNGYVYLALYSEDMQVDPPAEYWLKIKQQYVNASPIKRRLMELSYLWRFQLCRKPWLLPGLLVRAWNYKVSRGMNYMTDVRDWLGGWPMEFCRDADVIDYVTQECDLKLEKIKTGEANTEFLFTKTPKNE